MKRYLLLLCTLLAATTVSAQDVTVERSGHLYPAAELSGGYVVPYLGEAKDLYDSAWGLSMNGALGVRFYADENFFFEALSGYKLLYKSISTKGDDASSTISTMVHSITIPIHVGRHYSNARTFAGVRIDVPFSSRKAYNNYEVHTKTPVSIVVEGGIVFDQLQFLIGYSPAEKYTLFSIGLKV